LLALIAGVGGGFIAGEKIANIYGGYLSVGIYTWVFIRGYLYVGIGLVEFSW
jgi:hypothetical protein